MTSLLFGAMPALETRRLDLRRTLAAGTRAVAGGSGRIRQWLIGAEVALTVVLLAGAGLLVRTLVHLETLPPGFDATHVMTAKASLNAVRYNDPITFAGLLDTSLASMRRIPGVEDAAVGLSVPYERGLNYSLTLMDGPQAGKDYGSNLDLRHAWIFFHAADSPAYGPRFCIQRYFHFAAGGDCERRVRTPLLP